MLTSLQVSSFLCLLVHIWVLERHVWAEGTCRDAIMNGCKRPAAVWMCQESAESERTTSWKATPCHLSAAQTAFVSVSLSAFYRALVSPTAQNTVTPAHCVFRSSLILAAPVHTAAISWIILFVPLWRCVCFFLPSSPALLGIHKSLSLVCCLDERKDIIPLHASIWRGNSPHPMDKRCCCLASNWGV